MYFSPLSVTDGKQRERNHPSLSAYSAGRAIWRIGAILVLYLGMLWVLVLGDRRSIRCGGGVGWLRADVYAACSVDSCRDVPQYKVMKYLVFWIILSSLLSELQVARERTHTCPRAYAYIRTLAARSSRQGGLSLETLSSEERLRCAPFLTVLGTHCISRSFPLPPQRMPGSPAVSSIYWPVLEFFPM